MKGERKRNLKKEWKRNLLGRGGKEFEFALLNLKSTEFDSDIFHSWPLFFLTFHKRKP